MNRPRNTLAEFTRIYLRSLDRPPLISEDVNENEDHFAAHVALGLKRAGLVQELRDL